MEYVVWPLINSAILAVVIYEYITAKRDYVKIKKDVDDRLKLSEKALTTAISLSESTITLLNKMA